MLSPDDKDFRNVITIVGLSGLAGILVGIARGIIKERHGGWPSFIRGVVASIITAILVALAIHDTEMSVTRQAAIIGVCAYVADDLLIGLLSLARLFATDPLGFAKDVWNSIRGGKKE